MEYIVELSKDSQSILITLLLLVSLYYTINIGNKYVHIDNRCYITKKHIALIASSMLVIIITYNLVRGTSILKEILILILYSIIISYVLNPLVNYFEKKGIKRSFGILMVYIFILTIIVLIFITAVPKIVKELENLIELIPDYTNKAYDIFNKRYVKYIESIEKLPNGFKGINQIVFENLNNIEEYSLRYLRKVTSSIINIITGSFKLLIVPIISFYFIKDKEYFKKKLYMIIPKAYRRDTIRLSRDIDLVLSKFVRGQIIISIIVGLLTMVGLLIIKLDFAILIGLVVMVFEIIPYFGPLIGAVLTVIFGLLHSPSKAIWGLIILTIVQQLESNVISPKIIGGSVGLHPVVVILVVIIGGSYFGVVGMLLAVPFSAILKIIVSFAIDKVSE